MNNSQLAHVWANKAQAKGNNKAQAKGNNMFFEGATVYSYGYHFPIATHVTNSKGEAAVIYTRDSYSKTTAKHQLEVWRALSYGRGSFTVFHGDPSTKYGRNPADKAALRESVRQYIADAKAAAQKAKKSLAHGDSLADSARTCLTEAARMSAFFKLGVKVPAFETLITAAEYVTMREKAAEWSSRSSERRQARWAARDARYKAEEEARKIQQAAAAFEAWRNGEGISCPWGYSRDDNGSAYLRVKGDEVQTSQGAQVPLSHAKRVFRFVKACKEQGQAWHRNGSQVRIGLFTLDEVTPEGNLRAGCHFLTWERIAECAQAGGFFEESASQEAVEVTAA